MKLKQIKLICEHSNGSKLMIFALESILTIEIQINYKYVIYGIVVKT